MLNKLRNNLRAVVLAVLVHVALIAMLVVSLDWTPKPTPVGTQPAVVQATVVDNAKLKAAQQKKQGEAERKQRAEQEAADKLRTEEQRREEEKRRAEEEAQRKTDDEAKRQEQIKQEHLVAEQKRAEAAKREALKEKQHAEQLRNEEEKSLAAADARRKIEAGKKRKTEKESQQRREAEQQLKDQLASEEQVAREQQAQTLISQYIPLIKKRVEENWLRPPSAKAGMSCTVTVRLLPSGEVTAARVTVSSGDAIFDRSVEAAVSKASPLPLPSDPALFEYFRELNFIFKP